MIPRILVFCLFIVIVVILVAAIVYLLKDKAKTTVTKISDKKEFESQLKKFPPAWDVWKNISDCLLLIKLETQIEQPGISHDLVKDLNEYVQRITDLLSKIQGLIENNPDKAIVVQNIEDTLPVVLSLFKNYVSFVKYGADSPSATENFKITKEGLLNAEESLKEYIDMLFQVPV